MSRPILSTARSIAQASQVASAPFSTTSPNERKRIQSSVTKKASDQLDQQQATDQPNDRPRKSTNKVMLPTRDNLPPFSILTYEDFAQQFMALNPERTLGKGDINQAFSHWKRTLKASGQASQVYAYQEIKWAVEAELFWQRRGQ